MKSPGVSTGAVILAAGNSSRYGALKQAVTIDGQPMVRRVAWNALAAGLYPVMVVVGAQGERVVGCLTGLDIHPVVNGAWTDGMGSSLSIGVKALVNQLVTLRSVMVMPADQPAITVSDLKRMLAAHSASPGRILASRHKHTLGPPCIFPITYVDELAVIDPRAGARALLEKHAPVVDGFDLPGAFLDIDTPEDLSAWLLAREERSDDGPA